MSDKEKKLMLVNEYGPWEGSPTGRNLADLVRELSKQLSPHQLKILTGFLRNYEPGGLKLIRILNLIYIYLKAPLWIMLYRPTHILVMTSPPGIQNWVAYIASFFKIKVGLWAMDLHPEIECRWLETKGRIARGIARAIRCLDQRALSLMEFAITLDKAMSSVICQKNPSIYIIEHPVMFPQVSIKEHPSSITTNKITFAYAGNLGFAHEITYLEELMVSLRQKCEIEMVAIGVNEAGSQKLCSLCRRVGAEYHRMPRMTIEDLAGIFHKSHYGIVLMKEMFRGGISPSKYLDYIFAGLPVVYCGPEGTNAHLACVKFNAGIWIPSQNSANSNIDSIVNEILNPMAYELHKMGAIEAAKYFQKHTSHLLVEQVINHWKI